MHGQTQETDVEMPVVFLGHGSPMTMFDDALTTAVWQALGQCLPRPKAILVISAHWYTHGTYVCTNAHPPTIHDFYGFAQKLYEITYTPPGAVGLAHHVQQLLGVQCHTSDNYGLDHGAWCVLKEMYPAADIPVTQLSVNADLSFAQAFQLGAKLSALRREGVLILGSGGVVHNLQKMHAENTLFPWAKQFDDEVTAMVTQRQFEDVIRISAIAPQGYRLGAPTPEHFLPLLYCMGASTPSDAITAFNRHGQLGSLSMTGYLFSSAKTQASAVSQYCGGVATA